MNTLYTREHPPRIPSISASAIPLRSLKHNTDIIPKEQRKPIAILLAFLLTLTFVFPVYAQQTIKPLPNPPLQEACGLDVMLVLDESGSIRDAEAVGHVQDATLGFLEALADTGSQVGLVEFNSTARHVIDYTTVTSGAGSSLETIFQPYLANDFDPPESPQWYTNWNDSMKQVALANDGANDEANNGHKADLVVFITDGDPTAFNNDHPGTNGPTALENVTYNTISNGHAMTQTIHFANVVKNQGSRIMAVGVGNALNSQASQDRLKAVAGPIVLESLLGDASTITADNLDDILTTDVALVEDFSDLKTALRYMAFALCGPSLTVNNKVDRKDGNGYVPAEGWSYSGDVSVSSTAGATDYSWIAPEPTLASGTPATDWTNETGALTFQWKPGQKVNSAIDVTAEDRVGYRFADVACTVRSLENPEPRELAVTLVNTTFTADLGPTDIATCDVRNDLVSGSIAVEASPPRQLLKVGETATFDYVIRNIGPEPLDNISIENSHCAAPTYVSGDNGNDGVLQIGEAWNYRCATPNTQTPYINLITVTATDPEGQPVPPGRDQSIVDVMDPAVGATLSPKKQYAAVGSDARLTMSVRNPGDVNLHDVRVSSAECSSMNYIEGDANQDRILQTTETWTYDCVVENIQTAMTVTATAEAEDEKGDPVTPHADTAEIDLRIDNVCNTSGFEGALHRTRIFGTGMGDRHETINPVTVTLPDQGRLIGLKAQFAGRWRGALPYAVTVESDYETIRMEQQTTINTYRDNYKLFTYETAMQPYGDITFSVEDQIVNGWRTPRGAVLYADYSVSSEYYEVVRQINEQAYWGWKKLQHVETVAIPPLAAPRTIYLSAVIIDNDPDDRPLVFRASAGNVTTEMMDYGPTHGPNLSIYYLKLSDVPAGTSQVELVMESPDGIGDSLEWAGYSLSLSCTPDSDNDGIPDASEDLNGDGDPANDDTDGDGTPNYLDLDDDGDGINTEDEDANGNLDPEDDDADGDAIPDYRDVDAVTPPDDDTDAPVTGADLSITMVALSGEEAIAGGRIEYSIVVRNNGPELAQAVEIADTLPPSTTIHSATIIDDTIDGMSAANHQPLAESSAQSAPESADSSVQSAVESADPSCTYTPELGNLLLCNLGDLPSGGVREISVKVATNPAILGGTTITNAAEVSSATADPATANNRAEATVSISSQSSLFIESNASNPSPAIGEVITYTVSVRNNGPSIARGVSIHQALPQEMEFIDSAIPCALEENDLGLNYACMLDNLKAGYLAVGQTVNVAIRAKVSDAAVCGPAWESLAWAQAENMNGHSFADVSVAAGCVADLRAFQFGTISANMTNGTLPAGQPITMTYMAENVGMDVAQNVAMDLLIEHDQTFDIVSVTPNVFGDRQFARCDVFTATNIQNGSKAIHCELDDEFEVLDLTNGGGRWLINVVIRSTAGGPFTSQATVTTSTADPVMDNNTVTSESLASILASVVPPLDTDGDTIPDYKDIDADNDGLTNAMEGDGDTSTDTDADGIPDYLDNDSDADGIDDAHEGDVDTDEDGTPDFRDDDSDADGIPDIEEGAPLQNGNAPSNGGENGEGGESGERSQDEVSDLDNDGIPDFQDSDSDNDTIPDSLEGNIDSDADGTPDYRDEDSDNDGTPDRLESVLDANNNGIADYKDPTVQTIRPDAGNALAAFSASDTIAQDGTVTLQWQTIDESGTTGFTVYRSNSATGLANTTQVAAQGSSPIPADAIKLNQAPMAPNGSGSSYSYTDQFGDAASVDGQSYSYWVEEAKADGTTVVHGPVEVKVGGAELVPAVMLPFITN